MDGSEQMVLIMELADGSVRDELKKLENMFGLSYQFLLLLIDHLGIFLLSYATLHCLFTLKFSSINVTLISSDFVSIYHA